MKFLSDFFPILLFFIAFKLYGIYAATAVAIVASVALVAWSWLRHRKVEKMQLITMGLIVVLGGATLWLQDPRFVMWKPTLVNWAFGAVFLGSQLIGKRPLVQRMIADSIELPGPVWRHLNLAWVVFFVLMGFANLYVAFYYAPDLAQAQRQEIWVNFKLFGMMGLTIAFVIAQAFYLARYIKDEEPAEENSD